MTLFIFVQLLIKHTLG